MRLRDAHRMDLLAMDRFSTCPVCAEYADPGATVCGECGARLMPGGGGGQSGREVASSSGLAVARNASRPLCPHCLIEVDTDDLCPTCGLRVTDSGPRLTCSGSDAGGRKEDKV